VNAPDLLDRLRAGLAGGPSPIRLGWHGRQRRRFLHEYHEMRARSGAHLYRVDGVLVWFGRMPLRSGVAEVAIRYHPAHPLAPPGVFVLSPSDLVERLPRRPDGSLALLSPGDYHAGLTAFDFWIWTRRLLREHG
jgi:hypothetical protein